jgi:hypothetical protein
MSLKNKQKKKKKKRKRKKKKPCLEKKKNSRFVFFQISFY